MRLLNTSTLELHSFLSATHKDTPAYAILSHTWEKEEIIFEDVQNGPHTIPRHKQGFAKVAGSARHAKAQGFDWIWIDTCCIDKSSSAELSESINSMFLWYMQSQVCFAYLSDVASPSAFGSSRWFSRGWTLQELIAPEKVEFLDSKWRWIGSRQDLAESLSQITGIDQQLLRGDPVIGTYSISTRMAWASHRQTSREEDRAYSLLGIFNVSMPLIYGEGLQSAFRRLQEEIIKTSSDQSIFAFCQFYWKFGNPERFGSQPMAHYLASHPEEFRGGDQIMDDDPHDRNHTALHPITLHPHGVTFRAIVGPATYHLDKKTSMKTQLVILNCCFRDDPLARPAFLVTNFDGLLARLESPLFRTLPPPDKTWKTIFIDSEGWGPGPGPGGAWVTTAHVDEYSEQAVTISQPPSAWSPERPHLSLCRLVTTSKHFSARQERVVLPWAPHSDYQALETVFGHLGSVIVTGPEKDSFHILWGYAKYPSSREYKKYGTNHLQYFGRRSVDAWKTEIPRCAIAEADPQHQQPGAPAFPGRISSMEMPKTGLSPADLPSQVISQRPSGLVVRVEVRRQTFLDRTCVVVEISDSLLDTDDIPIHSKLAREEPTYTHLEDSQ